MRPIASGMKRTRSKVAVDVSVMNKGDCWILDAGRDIFVYSGAGSRRTERLKAVMVANELRDEDHAGKARIHIIGGFSPPARSFPHASTWRFEKAVGLKWPCVCMRASAHLPHARDARHAKRRSPLRRQMVSRVIVRVETDPSRVEHSPLLLSRQSSLPY